MMFCVRGRPFNGRSALTITIKTMPRYIIMCWGFVCLCVEIRAIHTILCVFVYVCLCVFVTDEGMVFAVYYIVS